MHGSETTAILTYENMIKIMLSEGEKKKSESLF